MKVNNSIVTDIYDSEGDEISDKEFKRIIIRMINEIKEDRNECLNEF
jgi:hypothetical protein